MMCSSEVADPCASRQELALLRAQVRVEHQRGQPDDAVHRRPDLVAHVGEELALDRARLLRLLPRLFELARLGLKLGDQFAREPDGAHHPLAQPLGGPRGHRDVEAGAVEEDQLEDFGRPVDRAVLDERPAPAASAPYRPDREVREAESAPEVGVGLIGGADEQQKEEPALVGAGEVDRDDEDEDVEREKQRPEVDATRPCRRRRRAAPRTTSA